MTGHALSLAMKLPPWLDHFKPSLYARAPLFSAAKSPVQYFFNNTGESFAGIYSSLKGIYVRSALFLCSVLTLLLSALEYSYAHPGLIILVILFHTWLYALYMSRTRSPVPPCYMTVLGAVLIPTTSRWPSYYTARMRAALRASRPLLSTTAPSKATTVETSEIVFELDMDILLADIAAGRVELRSPDRDLQTLSAGRDLVWNANDEDGLGCSTLRIRLIAGFYAHARAWYADIACRALPVSEEDAFDMIVRTPTHALLDLDVIPSQHIPALLSRLPRNTRAILLLSSASSPYPTASAWPSQSSSSSLPALRAYPFTHPRSPAALRTQLPDLLRTLTKTGVKLEKVEDAGRSYADALVNAADMLECEGAARGAFVAAHDKCGKVDGKDGEGMRAWRAEVLRGRWEAALVRAGSVRKWAVSVRT